MKVFCDNATNFVGAAHYLEELKSQIEGGKQALETYALDQGFKFCFIPPRAPHFGGLWEAAVKSAKTLLLKVAGNALLTGEELNTLVVQVEAILNSRPLTPMSQDPNDGEALTPAHLLVGGTLSSLPYECPQDSNTKIPLSQGWRILLDARTHFWQAWSRDYILELQQRGKWTGRQANLQVGDMVVIQEDNTPTMNWLVGRILQTIQGADGAVRVADVKTSAGVLRRPIHKLALLPLD